MRNIEVGAFKMAIIQGLIIFILLFLPHRTLAYDFSGWAHGASGYDDAIQEAKNEDKPIVIYFHTEWCKWSKKMNQNYLASYDVEYFLNNIPKAEINPDKGSDEKALAEKYHITGYPSFLVFVPSINGNAKRIYPFRKGMDWTTDEFIDAIKTKLVNLYNNKGYSCYKKHQYDASIRYYDRAISFDHDDAYAYYGKGIVHHTVAYKKKDTSLLREAEEDYLKALEIDPDHTGCKKELKRLHKTMEKLGIR